MEILENIQGHQDLLQLNDAQRATLCRQIRDFLISHVSRTGGHLASNLGVVELTVAIETVFDTATDRLVFDVGHQSYVHKLLTGRQAAFDALRQYGGISGFPKPEESDTDAFVAGHASSSVSIALGLARARTAQNKDHHVIALFGDGAATGGMIYEGLNDAAVSGEPMILILNDNAMSIDRNVGGMAFHLRQLRTKERYLGMKDRYRRLMARFPGGKGIYRVTRSIKDWLKRMLIPATIFENMGFTYLGPVDGHDTQQLITLLQRAKMLERPVIIHALTQKGRGYKPAEEDPSKFHGIGKFDPENGEQLQGGKRTFSQAFGQSLSALARKEPKLCAITAAMPSGTGLVGFSQEFPNRFFDVGIAEEHAVSMAGGLAKGGMIPVVAIYSTFLQRAYDMLLQDVCMLNLPVIFAVDRAGLVGEDGQTHHGVFDTGFLTQAPGMTVLCPVSCRELEQMLEWAVYQSSGPVAIRYPRGGDRGYSESDFTGLSNAVSLHRTGDDLTVITYGTMLDNALQAAQLLQQQGVGVTVLRLQSIKPLPTQQVCRLCRGELAVVLEECSRGSGIGPALAQELINSAIVEKVLQLDLGEEFVPHGSVSQLYRHCGLDGQSIADKILEVIRHEN